MTKKAMLALIFLVPLLYISCFHDSNDYSTVSFLVGDVKINNAPLEIGTKLNERDVITTGRMSSCDIRFGDSVLRIKEESVFSIKKFKRINNKDNISLLLDVGTVLCKPRKLTESESFIVKTPTSIVSVKGTTFSVKSTGESTKIKVFEGKVNVLKRVKQIKGNTSIALAKAPTIGAMEEVTITKKNIAESEKLIEALMANTKNQGKPTDLSNIMKIAQNHISVSSSMTRTFALVDSKNELGSMKRRSSSIIRRIASYVKMEKETPKPDGRILFTKEEVFFIKQGKVIWEGSVINQPIKHEGKVFIASNDYIYCAKDDGPVLWRKKVDSTNNIELKGNMLLIYTKGRLKKLDIATGQE